MGKTFFLGLVFFSVAAWARVDLQTSQGTNDAGTQTYVQVTTYYEDDGTEKRDKPVCLLIKNGVLLNAGNAKHCLTSSKHEKAKPFKTATLNRDGTTMADSVIEEKQVYFPKKVAGKYDAEKIFAHLDDKGNLILVEQSADVPIDANKNATGGVITSTIVITQPVDLKKANSDGTLPRFTVVGSPPIVRGHNELTDLEREPNPPPLMEALAEPPKNPSTTVTAPPSGNEEDLLPGYAPPELQEKPADTSVTPPEICDVNPKSADYCSSLYNDHCVLSHLLTTACTHSCDSVASCVDAYSDMKTKKEFKSKLIEIAKAEKDLRQAEELVKENMNDSKLLAGAQDAQKAQALSLMELKTLENELDAMVNAQGSSGYHDCLPTKTHQSYSNFNKISSVERALKKCDSGAGPKNTQGESTDIQPDHGPSSLGEQLHNTH